MRTKILLIIYAVILVAGSLNCARGQTAFAGQEQRSLPIAVSAGMSNFDLDYGKDGSSERRMNGITATLDTDLPRASGLLRGFGLQIEGRDVNYLRPSSLSRMRQSTILGGTTYTWPYSHRVRPFAKYLWGVGSIDFPTMGQYSHDTRVVLAPGAGVECKVRGIVWVRGDYEYQFWSQLFGSHSLNPNGFTVSTVFDFRSRNRNRN